MVAKVKPGKTIRGILNYNENKVDGGKALCIHSAGFGCEAGDLSFSSKLSRFTNQNARNAIAKKNAVHIILSFAPSEQIDRDTLCQIVDTYMERLGFGEQPYLVYQHFDTHQSHLHIATINIREDGTQINMHYIGKNQSSRARREIEQEFGLIKADGRGQTGNLSLKPADLTKIRLGEVEVKSSISNIVRTVVESYKFASMPELNVILGQFNVYADMGAPDTRMYRSGGLVYKVIDEQGEIADSPPIKASSIHEKPTLKNIVAKFERNSKDRQAYQGRVMRTIDNVLKKVRDIPTFVQAMKGEGIHVAFYKNKESYIYGVTYVDNLTYCVFKGSDLRTGYSAKAILGKLQSQNMDELELNRQFVKRIVEQTDFEQGIRGVLRDWTKAGLMIRIDASSGDETVYRLGNIFTSSDSFLVADKNITWYLQNNGFNESKAARIRQLVMDQIRLPDIFPLEQQTAVVATKVTDQLSRFIDQLFEPAYAGNSLPIELLKEARKKRKRKKSQ
ncbi:relaxase/mobilization nuclease domain-containing protein [Chitinophaga defluvii]|uniref:Relaxase/mobilization nuclease domain-containing protein n=1 Tax=Chitinophaga defluvii TaxID=3163343 RepID=A0ABV2T8P1_9BACT